MCFTAIPANDSHGGCTSRSLTQLTWGSIPVYRRHIVFRVGSARWYHGTVARTHVSEPVPSGNGGGDARFVHNVSSSLERILGGDWVFCPDRAERRGYSHTRGPLTLCKVCTRPTAIWAISMPHSSLAVLGEVINQ